MQLNGHDIANRVKYNVITWDYGKDITVTLEDALISFESLRFMLGGAIKYPSAQDSVEIRHTEEYVYGNSGIRIPDGTVIKASAGHPIRLINMTKGLRTQIAYDSTAAENTYTIKDGTVINFKNDAMGQSSSAAPTEGDTIRIFWTEIVTSDTGDSTVEVTISPNTFPGSYRIVGDIYKGTKQDGHTHNHHHLGMAEVELFRRLRDRFKTHEGPWGDGEGSHHSRQHSLRPYLGIGCQSVATNAILQCRKPVKTPAQLNVIPRSGRAE